MNHNLMQGYKFLKRWWGEKIGIISLSQGPNKHTVSPSVILTILFGAVYNMSCLRICLTTLTLTQHLVMGVYPT